jgi:hypothetical protein
MLPIDQPPTTDPPSERTLAIQNLENAMLEKFQDVTAEVHAIRELMIKQEDKRASAYAKFKLAVQRAFNQFFSQW